MQRIIVVGTPGTGKSTLAAELSQRLGCPFLELDALFWQPNWTPVSRDLFRQRVQVALAPARWCAGGNYSAARDLIWQAADTLIWLDYSLLLTMSRLVRRTLRRIITREELWAGNRESWRNAFLQRDSLLLFALKTHHRRRHQFTQALTGPEYCHLALWRFRTPKETAVWLSTVASDH